MAGATTDIKSFAILSAESQLTSYPVGANQQLYRGCIALLSGSGATSVGFLKNAASPGSTDLVAGIIDSIAGGTGADTLPGILGGTTDGAVWVNVRTGTFMIQNSALNALSAASSGKTVYYQGENAGGPIVSSSSVGATLPTMGIAFAQDPGFANNYIPGSNYYPIKLNTIGGP